MATMKLVSYLKEEHEQLAVLVDGLLYDMELIHPDIPNTMSMFLNYWDELLPIAQAGGFSIREGHIGPGKAVPLKNVTVLAPVPVPPFCPGGYALRQHVAAAPRNRGGPIIPEFHQYPIF